MKNITLNLLITSLILFFEFPVYAQSNVELKIMEGHSTNINTLAFSPDGSILASAGEDKIICLWDVRTGMLLKTLSGHKSLINKVVFSPDGKYLLSGDKASDLYIWETEDYSIVKAISHNTKLGLNDILVSKKGEYFYTAVVVWMIKRDIRTGEKIGAEITPHENDIHSAAFNPTEEVIFTSSGDAGSMEAWDTQTGKKIWQQKIGDQRFTSGISASSNGRWIASYYYDGIINIWSQTNGKKIKTIKAHGESDYINAVRFSPDSEFLITGATDNKIKIWSIKEKGGIFGGLEIDQIKELNGHTGAIEEIQFSPDGKLIASAGRDYTVRIWDTETGKNIFILSGYISKVNSIDFDQASHILASGHQDRYLRLWDLEKGKIVKTEAVHKEVKKTIYPEDIISKVRFDKDGNSIFTSDNDLIHKWSIEPWKEEFKVKGSSIFDICFLKDELAIYTSDYKSGANIEIRNSENGQMINSFPIVDQSGWPRALKYSRDGSVIAYSGDSGGTGLYDPVNGKKAGNFKVEYRCDDISFSPDNSKIATAGVDIDLWPADGKEKLEFLSPGYLIRYSPDGNILAGAKGNDVVLWNRVKNFTTALKGHTNWIKDITFIDGGKRFISCGSDGRIIIWDSFTKETVVTLLALPGGYDYVIYSPDGYFMSSKTGLSAVNFVLDGQVYKTDQFELKFNRPDIILQRLGYASPEVVKSYKNAYLKRLAKLSLTEESLNDLSSLPTAEIKKEKIPLITSDEKIKLEITASDSKYYLNQLNVYVNGSPLWGSSGMNLRNRNTNKIQEAMEIKLSHGRNTIQVSVRNEKGTESLKETVVIECSKPFVKPDLYIIGIGVSEYMMKDYNLSYASKDAKDIISQFSSQNKMFGRVRSFELNDSKADKETILNLKNELMNTTVDDYVIVFYAGHGVLDDKLDYYLATHDIDFEEPASQGLAYDDLEGLLDGIPSRKKLLFIDACHSGEIDKTEQEAGSADTNLAEGVKTRGIRIESKVKRPVMGLQNSFELMTNLFTNLEKGSGALVISSAGGGEFAFESKEWNNGVFTYSLLEGLKTGTADKSGDGNISVEELKEYVTGRSKTLTGGKQTPTSRRENPEFDFRIW